jgi:hypothetical protein
VGSRLPVWASLRRVRPHPDVGPFLDCIEIDDVLAIGAHLWVILTRSISFSPFFERRAVPF